MSRRDDMHRMLHRAVFPRWSADFKYYVLLCACASALCGALLVHLKNPLWIYPWHAGVLALLPCTWLYLKGTYLKYLDYAWDVYY